jgi:hypothetical protein
MARPSVKIKYNFSKISFSILSHQSAPKFAAGGTAPITGNAIVTIAG